MRSRELHRAPTPSTSPRRATPRVLDAHRSPLGSHQTPSATSQLRRASRTTSGQVGTSVETIDDLWSSGRAPKSLASRLPTRPSAPRSTGLRRLETAPRLRRDRFCLQLRATPRGVSPVTLASPDLSWDSSPDPSTPSRSEDRLDASRRRGAPKTTMSFREPVSEPQDPIAATHATSPSRRTLRRRRHMRRDPADRSVYLELA